MSDSGHSSVAGVPTVDTTQDDRTMSVLAHVLQLVGGFIAPLVIFFIRPQSRFVKFHALQVLFLQLLYMAINGCFMMFWISGFLLVVLRSQDKSTATPPTAFFLLFPVAMLGFMLMWLATIVLGIVYSVRAGRGEWAEYPLLGRWARRVLNIDTGGVPIP